MRIKAEEMADEHSNTRRPSDPHADPRSPPRVRFSTDEPIHPTSLDASPPPAGPRPPRQQLTIDTQASESANGGVSDIEAVREDDPQEIPIPRRSQLSPDSPVSPRRRGRGYSLRSQLLFRNTQSQIDNRGRSSGAENIHPPPITDGMTIELATLEEGNGNAENERTGKSSKWQDSDQRKNVETNTTAYLPNYTEWTKVRSRSIGSRVTTIYQNLRKRILRINEIPPSKDGRHIPIDICKADQLIDERTKRPYVNNTIRSSRYTVWNFLPRQLIAQFSKLANFYFLCVSILQMIPTLSTTGTYTTIVPLLFFISLSIGKEGYDDYRRYKLDKQENNRTTKVLRQNKQYIPDNDAEQAVWEDVKWEGIRVGDIIKLDRDDWVPADLLLLSSEGANGVAYIETAALDGETNLKTKQAIPMIAEACGSAAQLANVKAEAVVEDPNLDLYNFEGNVTLNAETKPLTNNQVIYRGSIVRNTPSCIGLVIFSGEESKIRMNANKNPRTKAPSLQTLVNRIVMIVVAFVIALSVFNTVAYQIWRNRTEKRSWYLEDSSVPFFPIFAGFVIMFNTLIPLSLYVSLEIIKVAQMILLNDIDMYDEETNTPLEARTSTINEDLGQISFIFSDKTGTLTDNAMLFRKLTVAGTAWIHDLDIRSAEDGQRPVIKHKQRKPKQKKKVDKAHGSDAGILATPKWPRKSMGDNPRPRPLSMDPERGDGLRRRSSQWKSPALPSRPQIQLSTLDLLRYLHDHPHKYFARKARFFLLSIALCHTCLPEKDENDEITYQSASPDELALVRAARELGYLVADRDVNYIYVKTFPNGPDGGAVTERYEILDVIEFSSARKRMSIVVRLPNNRICIFCKGADSTMIQLLRLAGLARQQASEVERRVSLRRSMEAQEVIRRNSIHRPSIGGPRNSMNLNRLHPIRDELNEWLQSRDRDVDLSSTDGESVASRPSGQYSGETAIRHSIAFGEAPRSPLERDTSDDLVDENLALDDAKVFSRCFGHINDFASEGLRTLLYGYRYIDDQEYSSWKKIYSEATTSLVNRQQMIERAAEMLERDFELGGGTAIEDKLQKGVPMTIDKLRRAGIKLWMLTGDKRETAINIGHSCRLIKDYSIVTILDKDNNDVEKRIAAAILEINSGLIAHSVVVIDGATLSTIEADDTLRSLFFDLAILTDSVICCRASPSQKASLVKAIRKKVVNSVTLAIGDGANDIAMIQEAHVGIGITGKEGLQAARVSDYSIAQFRFLLKLLLVHGRWNYDRTCKYVLVTFWKELVFYLTQAVYQRYNGYTGTSFYEPWSLSMFNTLFTSLPVIFLGIFEKDLSASTLLAVPELYQRGQRGDGFNYRKYFGWMFLASTQAMIIYFMIHNLYGGAYTVKDNGVYAIGALSYSVCVVLISSKLQLIEMHNKSVLALFSFVCSVGGWFAWNLILGAIFADNTVYNVKRGIYDRFGRDLSWWLVLAFTLATCLLVDVAFITIRVALWPTDVDTFQEIEKHPELRTQLEEAASAELQQGWRGERERGKKGKGKGKDSRRSFEAEEEEEEEEEDDDDDIVEVEVAYVKDSGDDENQDQDDTDATAAGSKKRRNNNHHHHGSGFNVNVFSFKGTGSGSAGGSSSGNLPRRRKSTTDTDRSAGGVGGVNVNVTSPRSSVTVTRLSESLPNGVPRSSLHMPTTERAGAGAGVGVRSSGEEGGGGSESEEEMINRLVARRFGSIKR
ncbi:phospholipid-translocating P-type ATPase [Peziza echinospora]|nr:phospholipid-translocating P-type ATPase [Peziza echinospora]